MRHFLLVTLLLKYICIHAQVAEIWAARNLKGTVRVVKTYEYYPDKNGASKLGQYNIAYFDKQGRVIAESNTWDTTIEGTTTNFIYKKGVLKEVLNYREKGNRRVYTYKGDSVVTMDETDKYSKTGYHELSRRDAYGREYQRLAWYNPKTVHTNYYEYDAGGHLVKETRDYEYTFDGSNSPKQRVFTYDKGNVIECDETLSSDNVIYNSFSYDAFDETGNWVKMTHYVNGQRRERMERLIEYY